MAPEHHAQFRNRLLSAFAQDDLERFFSDLHPESFPTQETVFPVEIRICENHEKVVTEKMTSMREWLDHRRFEPSTFRYTFEAPGLVFKVEFKTAAEAIAFAHAFGGQVTRLSAGKQAAA